MRGERRGYREPPGVRPGAPVVACIHITSTSRHWVTIPMTASGRPDTHFAAPTPTTGKEFRPGSAQGITQGLRSQPRNGGFCHLRVGETPPWTLTPTRGWPGALRWHTAWEPKVNTSPKVACISPCGTIQQVTTRHASGPCHSIHRANTLADAKPECNAWSPEACNANHHDLVRELRTVSERQHEKPRRNTKTATGGGLPDNAHHFAVRGTCRHQLNVPYKANTANASPAECTGTGMTFRVA